MISAQRHRISPCFTSENKGFANNCQLCELHLDYVQFGCIVQLEELAVTMARQQGRLKLDYVQFGCIVQLEKLAVNMTRQQGRLKLDYVRFECVVQLEELAVTTTRQQSGLKLDSGWTTPWE